MRVHAWARRLALLPAVLIVGAVPARGALPADVGNFDRVVSPLRDVRADAAVDAVSRATAQDWLTASPAGLAALEARKGRFRMEGFPIGPGLRADLLLERFQVVTAGAQVITMTAQGERREPLQPVTQFKGTVDGQPDSRVYVGVAGGVLVAYIQSDAGLSFVGPEDNEAGAPSYIVRAAGSRLYDEIVAKGFACRADELPELAVPATSDLGREAVAGPSGAIYDLAAISIETDQELRNFFPSAGAMIFYIQNLFGAGSVIYERDLTMRLEINLVQVWETPDPYGTATDTQVQLFALSNWWHHNRPKATYPRSTVHFLSKVGNNGGLAFRPAFCANDVEFSPPGSDMWGGGYGVSQIHADYPSSTFDLIVTTHELGHNAGSKHTHCFVPPIDMCFSGDVSGGVPCYSGPTSLPPGGGTIMSYCHTLAGGLANVNLLFHNRCISEQMLPYLNPLTCFALIDDQPLAFNSITPPNGTIAGGTTVTVAGNGFKPGVNVELGGTDVLVTLQNHTGILGFTQPHALGVVNVVVKNLDTTTVTIPNAFTYHFGDVAPGHPFFSFVNRLANFGVTSGCGGGNYCPDTPVNREQMAVFLLVSKEGSGYNPPACVTPAFGDVPCASPFAKWINELTNPARAITAGCGGGNYCPTDTVTRETMAVFLLRTHGGAAYTPPNCTVPVFSDVPCASPFAKWVNELNLRGITGGCGGGLYCPTDPVSRGSMAVFLVVTFNIPV